MEVFLLTIDAAMDADNGGFYQVTTLRFSSGEYNNDGMNWEPRLKQPSLFVKGASTGNILPNTTTSSFGETVLVNPDGGLDYLMNYALDGRELLLQMYDDETGVLSDIVKTTVSSVSFSRSEVSFTLKALHEALSQEHPQDEYKGDNVLPDGLEGVATDIKGNRKPKVFGEVHNASPFLVNTSNLIYQVASNDCTVTAVYDKGVLLAKEGEYTSLTDLQTGGAPATGKFKSYKGYFRLGSSPVGTVTCNAETPNKLLGDIFESVVVDAGYTACPTCKSRLNSVNYTGVGGIYLKDLMNTSDLLDMIADSSLSYWTTNTSGVIVMEKISVINRSDTHLVDFELQDYQIIDINVNSLGGGSNGVPIYKFVAEYDKIETVQNDFAGAVTEGDRGRKSVQYREVDNTANAIKDFRHLLSEEKVVQTVLRGESNATNLMSQYVNLLGFRRDSVDVKVRLEDVVGVDIGKQCLLFSRYFGYSSGRTFTVVGLTINMRKQEVTLNLFG